jgi:hypothetical protein
MTLNTNNIINLLSHPLSLSEYVWIIHSTLVTIATYTTDGSDYIYLCACPVISDERKASMSEELDDPCIRPGFPTSYVMVFILFSEWEVRGDCSFHWYWWNCWPSLIKLSFHKHFGNTLLLLFNNWHKGNP